MANEANNVTDRTQLLKNQYEDAITKNKARQEVLKQEFAQLEANMKELQEAAKTRQDEFNQCQNQIVLANQGIATIDFIQGNPEASAETIEAGTETVKVAEKQKSEKQKAVKIEI